MEARLDTIRRAHLRPGPQGPEVFGAAADALRAFAMIEAVENGTPKARRDYQQERVTHLLDHARCHSPFWAARIPPGKSALWRLPVLRKAELRAQVAAEGALPVPAEHGPVARAFTSGSTAEPLSLYVTLLNGHYNEARNAFDDIAGGRDLALPMTVVSFKVKQAQALDAWPTLTGEIWHTGPARVLPVAAAAPLEALAEQALDGPLGHLVTMPSVLSAMLDVVERRGRQPDPIGDLLPFGETVWPGLRDRARRLLGARIADRYSCEEVGPIAFQCPTSDAHYHVASSNVLLECVDERGREVAEGRPGNLLVTGLNAVATPVLRYTLGDVARLLPRCVCGHAGPALADLQGRRRSLLRLPDGRRRLWHMGNAASAAWLGIAPVTEVRVTQTGARTLRLEVAAARALTEAERDALAAQLRAETARDFEVSVAQLPRIDWGTSGKRHTVVNLLEDEPGESAR